MEFANCGELGKFAASVAHPEDKRVSVSRELRPLTMSSAPGPRYGLRLQTPVIGSRSGLAVSVHPTYFDLATPHSQRTM